LRLYIPWQTDQRLLRVQQQVQTLPSANREKAPEFGGSIERHAARSIDWACGEAVEREEYHAK
jgi:hypothetical protein